MSALRGPRRPSHLRRRHHRDRHRFLPSGHYQGPRRTAGRRPAHRPHHSTLPTVGVPEFDSQRGHVPQMPVVLERAILIIDRRQDLLNGRKADEHRRLLPPGRPRRRPRRHRDHRPAARTHRRRRLRVLHRHRRLHGRPAHPTGTRSVERRRSHRPRTVAPPRPCPSLPPAELSRTGKAKAWPAVVPADQSSWRYWVISSRRTQAGKSGCFSRMRASTNWTGQCLLCTGVQS